MIPYPAPPCSALLDFASQCSALPDIASQCSARQCSVSPRSSRSPSPDANVSPLSVLARSHTDSLSPDRVAGVDFSGAARSGPTTWMATAEVVSHKHRLRLQSLTSLGELAGDESRAAVTKLLVEKIQESKRTLWGIDFPFGLPIELGLGSWRKQLQFTKSFPGSAKELGRHLVGLAKSMGHPMHVRRVTDRETKTPFDCYHYRIIYQTFHGMRDVLSPLARHRTSCVLPFQYSRMSSADRWIVEACPSSTLKRLGLPYRLYKQSGGKDPTELQVKVRKAILDQLSHRTTGCIDVQKKFRDTIYRDSGGDALDAVLAAVGSYSDFCHADHDTIARHARYKHEGRVYA